MNGNQKMTSMQTRILGWLCILLAFIFEDAMFHLFMLGLGLGFFIKTMYLTYKEMKSNKNE